MCTPTAKAHAIAAIDSALKGALQEYATAMRRTIHRPAFTQHSHLSASFHPKVVTSLTPPPPLPTITALPAPLLQVLREIILAADAALTEFNAALADAVAQDDVRLDCLSTKQRQRIPLIQAFFKALVTNIQSAVSRGRPHTAS